jgi:hypothetical protein
MPRLFYRMVIISDLQMNWVLIDSFGCAFQITAALPTVKRL